MKPIWRAHSHTHTQTDTMKQAFFFRQALGTSSVAGSDRAGPSAVLPAFVVDPSASRGPSERQPLPPSVFPFRLGTTPQTHRCGPDKRADHVRSPLPAETLHNQASPAQPSASHTKHARHKTHIDRPHPVGFLGRKPMTYLAMALFSTARTTQSLPWTPTTVDPLRTASMEYST